MPGTEREPHENFGKLKLIDSMTGAQRYSGPSVHAPGCLVVAMPWVEQTSGGVRWFDLQFLGQVSQRFSDDRVGMEVT